MAPLSDRAPRNDKILLVFYDFETKQNAKCTDTWFERVPNLVWVQKSCAMCKDEADVDNQRCSKRKHSFWTDPVGDLISYTFKFRPWADRVVAISHKAKTFELHSVLNRLVRMMVPELLNLKRSEDNVPEVENVIVAAHFEFLCLAAQKFARG